MERESMPYDVVIVGAGPAGLAAACRLKQVNSDISVCVVEKGSEVGAHIVSGAVLDPIALNELFPDWRERGAPVKTAVGDDHIYWFGSATAASRIPGWAAPKTMHNQGNYIISLANLCRWLAQQAEQLGVEIFPGFAAAEVLYSENGAVKGILIGDMGVDAAGQPKSSHTPGMELHSQHTLFAEGCRGHLGKTLIGHYSLDQGVEPQHYGLGIKEIWKVSPEHHKEGLVVHTAGWPLSENGATGGGFLYHVEDQQVVVGLITDLAYNNPYLNPFEEFQRFKHHPKIKETLTGGQRLVYGARAITKGGVQSQPKMHFPGGLLLGDNAGTLNFAKIKGTHTAMKSGMIAAEVVARALADNRSQADLVEYGQAYRNSWAWQELHTQRNFGPAIHKWGPFLGGAYAFIDINLCGGKLPWTLSDPVADHAQLKRVGECQPIQYPKPDGVISFDRLSSVYLSNTNHEEDQPCHLRLASPEIPIAKNLPDYGEPAQRYCPAGVYEVLVNEEGQARFQINAQNCVHCKTCDIKDPAQNITWVTPEGGGGPNYPNM
jgi:electron-transferring-flavoprotein dehydrogenase